MERVTVTVETPVMMQSGGLVMGLSEQCAKPANPPCMNLSEFFTVYLSHIVCFILCQETTLTSISLCFEVTTLAVIWDTV